MGADQQIRDPEFAKRLEQACDANFHCPQMHYGRLTWIKEQLGKSFDEDVAVQTIARWMNGVVKPRQKTNVKLAQLLGVDPVWLYLGVQPDMTPKERKVRNASANGIHNVIAGFIQMDGGAPAFPAEDDKRAQRDRVDLYAVIRGANYAFHISLAWDQTPEGVWRFPVPMDIEHTVVLGVVREGFKVRIVEITPELIERNGGSSRSGLLVSLTDSEVEERQISSFANRL